MTKRALMEYLKIVCEAEETLYACDETIAALQEQMERRIADGDIFEIIKPEEPQRKTPKYVSTKNNPGCLGSVTVWIFGILGLAMGGWISTLIANKDAATAVIIGLLCGLGGACLGAMLSGVPGSASAASENKKLDEQAKQQYQAEMKNYRANMLVYNDMVEAEKHTRSVLAQAEEKRLAAVREAIAENENTRKRVRQSLDDLYSRGILYPTFHNLIAVHQIYEYMAMGVCETLEGPTGAYSVYLNDLRTNKICESISELKITMANMMSSFIATQGLLLQEMRATNDNITSLQQTVGNGLQSIESELYTVRQTMRQSEEERKQIYASINHEVEEMRKIMMASAHNDYVNLRERNIKRYLLQNHGLV